jgi:NADPH:quinone reductase-like Zn-dependent oxidoreductase
VEELIDGGLRPVIGDAIPLEQGSEALRRMESRAARAKIVLTVGGKGECS